MAKKSQPRGPRPLSRREQQIMDIVYARGRATSAEVLADIQDPPTYSSIRALMRILVNKGLLRRRLEGIRYMFEPVAEVGRVRKSVLARVLNSFFADSPVALVATLLDSDAVELTPAQLQELKHLIAEKQNQKTHQPKPRGK